jgi:hypothetical protein
MKLVKHLGVGAKNAPTPMTAESMGNLFQFGNSSKQFSYFQCGNN